MNEATTLETLAAEIRLYDRNSASCAIEIGKRLILAKKQIEHGDWEAWLKDKVSFNRQTAWKFMQCAERFGNVSISKHLSGQEENVSISKHLSLSKMFEILTLPEDETQDFIAAKEAEGNSIENMTVKELRAEVAAWKNRLTDADTTIADLRHENKLLRDREPEPVTESELAERLKASEAETRRTL